MKITRLMIKQTKRIIVKIKNRRNNREGNIWVFGEWFGEKCLDNSMHFANYVAAVNPELELYWVANQGVNTNMLDKRIQIIERDSDKARSILSKCGVAVLSQSFEDFSSDGCNYAEGAVIVHLWHGVPWKKIGHDANGKISFFTKLYIKLLDYLDGVTFYVSPSDKYDAVVRSAFGAKSSQIIHTGYARNADFYVPEKVAQGKTRILDELKKIAPEFNFDACKIISYMPTFRNDPSASRSLETLRDNKRFMNFLESHNAVIIQKSHFVNQTRDGRNQSEGSNRFFLLNNIAAQDLLCATDLLVTDYSGAFFDYLLLDRPIVHYLYDYDYYRTQDRGLYYNKEDVIGGEEAENESQLIDAVVRNVENPGLYSERRHFIRSVYMKYDTEKSCEVLYQEISNELKRRNFR